MSNFRQQVKTATLDWLKPALIEYQENLKEHSKLCPSCGRRGVEAIDMCDDGYLMKGRMQLLTRQISKREQQLQERCETLF